MERNFLYKIKNFLYYTYPIYSQMPMHLFPLDPFALSFSFFYFTFLIFFCLCFLKAHFVSHLLLLFYSSELGFYSVPWCAPPLILTREAPATAWSERPLRNESGVKRASRNRALTEQSVRTNPYNTIRTTNGSFSSRDRLISLCAHAYTHTRPRTHTHTHTMCPGTWKSK